MKPLRIIKEMQHLTGRIATLNRFFSRSIERSLPFFKAQIGKEFPMIRRVPSCNLKKYLGSPPLLNKPESKEVLYLYLVVSPSVISFILVRQEVKVQKPIYYISRVLHDTKTRYTKFEKVAYALVISSNKLRPYFQAHTIAVLANQPIKLILHRSKTSG